MPQAELSDIVAPDQSWDDQDIVRMANLASGALEDAAYYRGKCDGLEITLAYLKHRLDRIEAKVFEKLDEL